MQKAYLTFSTAPVISVSMGSSSHKFKWQDQITKEQKIHSDILTKLQNGERVEGIEKDPLESKESDYVLDYSHIPGFIQRE